MEHTTSAVNWQPVNMAKRRGELARDSLTHVAHGADAVCFFQWRQSAAGAEKYHSAMLPHAGEDSAVFRAVTDLGACAARLWPRSAGTAQQPARAAILFDWVSWWAAEHDSHPSSLLRYRQEALDWYSAFLALGVRADVIPVSGPLESYDLVVAPILHVVPSALAERLTAYVDAGGHLVTTYFSGIVDDSDQVWLGGYPGALRELLGIRVEEFAPLLGGQTLALDNGTTATLWSEPVEILADEVEILARYEAGEWAGRPAVTRRSVGDGSATYVSTRLGPTGLTTLLTVILDRAGIDGELPEPLRGRLELAVRGDGTKEYWFLINRTDEPVDLSGTKALSGVEDEIMFGDPEGSGVVAPRGVVVLQRPIRES